MKKVRGSKWPRIVPQDERRLLRLLARGEREIAADSGHDLDAVMRDADARLKRLAR